MDHKSGFIQTENMQQKKKRIMSINIPNNRLKKQKRDRKRESKQA